MGYPPKKPSKLKSHLAIFLPYLRVLPTENLGIKETIPFAWSCFRTCLPADLCVLITEGDMLGRPGVIEGIEVKSGI